MWGCLRRPSPSPANNPLELTAHSAGFWGKSWRFPLWAAAQRERRTIHISGEERMTVSVFVSYRRDDSSAEAGAICRAVRDQIGPDLVFMDTSSIPAGASWPQSIQQTLSSAALVIAVIGPDWVRASDEWGRRRIDSDEDWVRREVETALALDLRIIPVFVRGARMPPMSVLPKGLQKIVEKQAIELRRDYWDHDILLLLAQLEGTTAAERPSTSKDVDPYPKQAPEPPDPLDEEKLRRRLAKELTGWKQVVSPLPGNESKVRIELSKEYKFPTFVDTIRFMLQVAPGCDIAMHHPRWENIWKTLSVHLSTWDHGLHKITDRDTMLAKYFDRAYTDFIKQRRKKS